MSEQDQPLEGTNQETEAEIDFNLEEEEISEDQDEIIKKKDEAIRQLTARAKKAEALAKNITNQSRKAEVKGEDTEDIKQTVQELKLAETKRQFGYANGLSPEETDYLFKISPNPSKELLEDPFIKGGIEAIRKTKRAEQNTPALNSRSPRFEVPKKKDLTLDDKQKAFEDYMSNIKNKNR
jgi:hypothetical protein